MDREPTSVCCYPPDNNFNDRREADLSYLEDGKCQLNNSEWCNGINSVPYLSRRITGEKMSRCTIYCCYSNLDL